jgi:hypothetical protein
MALLPTDRIEGISAKLVAQIPTPPCSVFYSLKQFESGPFEAFYRRAYNSRILGRCIVDPDAWKILADDGAVCYGEDPRVLSHGHDDYVMDNTWDSSGLIIPDNAYERFPLPSRGKNLTLISAQETLLCVEWLRPLNVLSASVIDGNDTVWTRIACRDRSERDIWCRGGTPGYLTPKEGVFVGFGHQTLEDGRTVAHKPFAWRLDTGTWDLQTQEVDPRAFSWKITDPTSVVERGGRYFLITAESQLPWFGPLQDLATRVYELTFS